MRVQAPAAVEEQVYRQLALLARSVAVTESAWAVSQGPGRFVLRLAPAAAAEPAPEPVPVLVAGGHAAYAVRTDEFSPAFFDDVRDGHEVRRARLGVFI